VDGLIRLRFSNSSISCFRRVSSSQVRRKGGSVQGLHPRCQSYGRLLLIQGSSFPSVWTLQNTVESCNICEITPIQKDVYRKRAEGRNVRLSANTHQDEILYQKDVEDQLEREVLHEGNLAEVVSRIHVEGHVEINKYFENYASSVRWSSVV
jgi:hypothetical protein